jgi:hypothetical protein
MSVENLREAPRPADPEAAVTAYLEQHPEYFRRHPDLLASLRLPHESGGAVSLVEYQMAVLRDQNLHLRRRLESLLATARDNERLSERLHRLTLELLGARTLDQACEGLYGALQRELGAEAVSVRLAWPEPGHEAHLAELVPAGAPLRGVLEEMLAARGPLCGPLDGEAAELVFGERRARVRSAVVLPFGEVERFGLLALGSGDPQRYQPGMGTLFLRQLAEVTGRVLGNLRRQEPA